MKALSILFLFCASVYGADTYTTNTVGDITTVISERTKDSKPVVRFETVYRGPTKILQTMSQTNKLGMLAVVSRSYYLDHDAVFIETDEDGDGTFEHLSLQRPSTHELEMFTRQPDGAVKPVSTKTIEATKKQLRIMSESMGRLIEKTNVSDQDISKELQETRQRISDLEKQKKADEK